MGALCLQDGSNLVIACNPNYAIAQAIEMEKAKSAAIAGAKSVNRAVERPFPPSFSHLLRRPALWLAGLAMLATVIIVMLAGQPWRVDAENLAANPAATLAAAIATNTITVSVTANPAISLTATAVSSQTATSSSQTPTIEPGNLPAETAVSDPPATSSPESKVEPSPTSIAKEPDNTAGSSATALLSSSLYGSPDSNSQEVTFIGVGEAVKVWGALKLVNGFMWKMKRAARFCLWPATGMVQGILHLNDNDGNSCFWQQLVSTIVAAAGIPARSSPSFSIRCPGHAARLALKYRTVFMQGAGWRRPLHLLLEQPKDCRANW